MEVETGFSKYVGRVPPLDLTSVSLCDNNNMDMNWNKFPAQLSHFHRHYSPAMASRSSQHGDIPIGADDLPIDPRDWTRADVWKWLVDMALSEGLAVTPDLAQKFPMNGKALCLMTLDMYLSRVPVGGKMLYRDFRLRLARAMALYP